MVFMLVLCGIDPDDSLEYLDYGKVSRTRMIDNINVKPVVDRG